MLYQFQILQQLSFRIFFFDFSLINFLLTNLLSFIYCNVSHKNYLQEIFFFLGLNFWQKNIEFIFEKTIFLTCFDIQNGN